MGRVRSVRSPRERWGHLAKTELGFQRDAADAEENIFNRQFGLALGFADGLAQILQRFLKIDDVTALESARFFFGLSQNPERPALAQLFTDDQTDGGGADVQSGDEVFVHEKIKN